MKNDYIKAAILSQEVFYPYLDAKIAASKTEKEMSKRIMDVFFISSPFERVLRGEKYEDIEKELFLEVEEFKKSLERSKDGTV